MPDPSCIISFSPAGITQGQTSTFSWQYSDKVVRYVSNCTGDLGATSNTVPSPVGYNGNFTVSPSASQTCTNTVYDAANNPASCSATITVNPPGGCPPGQNNPHTECQGASCVPVAGCGVSSCSNDNQCGGGGGQQQNQGGGATITAAPSSITEGQSTQLSWVYQGQGACSIDQGIGSVANSGSVTVSPTLTTTYTITCGAASAHVTVLVSGKPKFKEVVPE